MKSKYMKRIKYFIIFLFYNMFTNAANSTKDFVNVVPPSPNASSLAMYSDYPVSYYTGIPEISIPIYEINVDGFKLPISLSYHSSGIKVGQEASWVGLGWTLNAGGCISRTIRGTDDFNRDGGSWGSSYIQNGFVTAPDIDDLSKYIISAYPTPLYINDSEPDIFYITLPNYSDKFIINKSQGPVFFNANRKLKMNYALKNAEQFIVYDTDGTKYYFSAYEECTSYSGNGSMNIMFNNADTDGSVLDENQNYVQSLYTDVIPNHYISSWYLSKIITPHNREINFIYDIESYVSPTMESCHRQKILQYSIQSYQCLDANTWGDVVNGFTKYNRTKQFYNNLRLSKIQWDNGYITFNASAREDEIGIVSDGDIAPKKLDKISIYNSNNESIKSFGFSYDYFNNTIDKGKYNYLFKRLKLTGLNEISAKSTIILPYTFSYYEGDFPKKNSNNVDFWGYNNGANYGLDYYPKVKYNNTSYSGVDKSSNYSFLVIGSLMGINYPTGGFSRFTYEENEFIPDIFDKDYYLTGKGGGLRISSISTNEKTRKFLYTGGRLISKLCSVYSGDYYNQCVVNHLVANAVYTNYYDFICQSSNSIKPLSSLKQGNTVGYNSVTESIITSTDTLSTINYYNNEAEDPADSPYIPNIPIMTNGQLVRTEYVSSLGSKVIDYSYTTIFTTQINGFYYLPTSQDMIRRYTLELSCQKLSEKKMTQNLNGHELTQFTSLQYNNSNYSEKQIINVNSKFIETTKIKYSTDYSDAISLGMTDKYMIGLPIETYTLRNDKVVNAQKTEYINTSGMYFPKKIFETQISTPVLENDYTSYYKPILYFDKYNSKGQPIQITDRNNITVVYLWSYNNQYPVAEIKNTTYSQLESILGSAYISNLAINPNPTDNDFAPLNNLRYNRNYPNIQVMTFKYIPLIGMSQKTDPRGITTYYKYDEFNRLKGVSDNKNLWLNQYNYHYYNQ